MKWKGTVTSWNIENVEKLKSRYSEIRGFFPFKKGKGRQARSNIHRWLILNGFLMSVVVQKKIIKQQQRATNEEKLVNDPLHWKLSLQACFGVLALEIEKFTLSNTHPCHKMSLIFSKLLNIFFDHSWFLLVFFFPFWFIVSWCLSHGTNKTVPQGTKSEKKKFWEIFNLFSTICDSVQSLNIVLCSCGQRS